MGKDYSELDRLIFRNDIKAAIAEHKHAINVYKPVYMLGLTSKYRLSEDEFNKAIRKYFHRTARRLAKVLKQKGVSLPHKHIIYEYWYDYQPNRKDEVLHAHAFIGIEGIEDINIALLDDVYKDLFWLEWKHGQIEVDKFNGELGGVIYSRKNHQKWRDGVGCSNGQHKCTGNKCAYSLAEPKKAA